MTWTRVVLIAYVALFNYPSGIFAAPRTRHDAPSLRHKSGDIDAELEEVFGYLDRGSDAEAANKFLINKNETQRIYSYSDDTGTTEKIIHGDLAPKSWRNWSVEIYNSHGHIICGGSRISPRLILTAAHCFFEPQAHGDPGGAECQDKTHDTQPPTAKLKPDGRKAERLSISLVYRHQSFRFLRYDRTYEFDVAIAVLSEEFRTPFSLGFNLSKGDSATEHDTCYAVGYGYTERRSEKPERVRPEHPHRRIIEKLKCTKIVTNLPPVPKEKQFFCTTESGAKGDSGSPVLCVRNGKSNGALPYLMGTIAQVIHNEKYTIVHDTGRKSEQWIKKFLNSTRATNYAQCLDPDGRPMR